MQLSQLAGFNEADFPGAGPENMPRVRVKSGVLRCGWGTPLSSMAVL